MDWSQALFVTALLGALVIGRAPPLLWIVMPLNLWATMELAGNPLAVGVADIMAATALAFATRRCQAVALLFVAMLPIYPLSIALGWSKATTYSIVDTLAYLQCGVIGRGDRGIAHCGRLVRGWIYRLNRATFARVQGATGREGIVEKGVR